MVPGSPCRGCHRIAQALALMLGARLLVVGVAYHCTFALCSSMGISYIQKGYCEGAALRP